MRGAATGALAFTVGGVEVLLTAPEARAQNVPFRLLKAGQTHEIPNLYIAGPGIFATAGASKPTYTIFALSLRGAEQLASQWSTVAG